jgi:glycosyltransferase involved in cell wall biosynthesis
VSVIVPNFNHARYLPARLDSIFGQTFRDFEVILLDDASTDRSREVLARYAGRADVQLVANEKNSGSTFRQWMKGLDLARGELIWMAESDDSCAAQFLERLLPAFADPAVRLAYADSHVIDARGRIVGDYTSGEYLRSLSATKWTRSHRTTAEREISEALGVKNTILSASAVVFRKFELSPGLRAQLATMRIAGDWLFFVHAIAGGDVWFEADKLSQHRRHRQSVVGKLLEQNRVRDFFREFHLVQREIFQRFPLDPAFAARWEFYLRGQWNAFHPGRAFEDILEYYPVQEARAAIAAATRD